jgi:predicted  nucleic acid-binding Zn-ribbon protein
VSAECANEPTRLYRNFYRCDDCGHEWQDEWSCMCDDDCPECGSRHWTPYESEDVEDDEP